MKTIYFEHPTFCIICNNKSYGETQCEHCFNLSKKFEKKLSQNKHYFNNLISINNLYTKTLKKYFKYENKLFSNKRIIISNQLIAIAKFRNKNFKSQPDLTDITYRLLAKYTYINEEDN